MGSEAEHVIDLYERHASDFDSDRGRHLMEKPWLDRLLALIARPAPILDIGCGSGEPIAGYFVRHGYAVTGVDTSPSLIALCRSRFPDHEWVVADMRNLSLASRFEAILAWDSFFHLRPDDQPRMFPLFESHAAPGAGLLFTTGLSRGEAIGSYRGEPLYHGSLDPADYRALLDKHGFEVLSHVVEDPSCGGHTIWLARLR